MRPCSQVPCLNNGTCINVNQNTTRNETRSSSSFECKCPVNFYGALCELRVDICQNMTCTSNGRCVDRNGEAKCECFVDYFGDNCENVAEFQTVRKSIQMSSLLILVGSISTLILLVVVSLVWEFEVECVCAGDDFTIYQKTIILRMIE